MSFQYKWIILIFIILGGLVGVWKGTKKNTIFKAETVVIFPEGMRMPVMQNINKFFTSDFDQIAIVLNNRNFKLPRVKSANFYNVIDSKSDNTADFVDYKGKVPMADTINVVMSDRILLQLQIKGEFNLDSLQLIMNQYLMQQPKFKEMETVYAQMYDSKLKMLDKDVNRIDSLASYDYFVRPNLLSMHKDAILLTDEEQKIHSYDLLNIMKVRDWVQLHNNLTQNSAITFESPFVITHFQTRYKIILGIIFGYFFGLIIALIIKNRSRISEFLKEK